MPDGPCTDSASPPATSPTERPDPPPPADWRAWLDRHGPALLLLARQLLPDHDAEDAVQAGFVRFWQMRSRSGIDDPVAYLFACVRSAALDLRRAGRRRQRREKAHPNRPLLAGPPQLDERRRLVETALAALPPEQREVLVLKVWAGLTFAQIAAALAISANTAASRYRYGLEKLHELLPPEVSDDR